MRPRTLSATSIESYEGCPARFAAEQGVILADGTRQRISTDSAPGIFGTALHSALDDYIEYLGDRPSQHDEALLLDKIWPRVAQKAFGFEDAWTEQGYGLLADWLTTRPLPHKVLSREVKETFDLVVPGYDATQPVTYICDRIDEREDGSIEVIDYKSQYLRVNATKMRGLIQPALYAAAMRRKYGVDTVHVTYDMLRYEMVTVTFDDTDLNRFEAYLGQVAARIWDDESPREKLNNKCQYCPRKAVCGTLSHAHEIGWSPSLPVESLIYIRDQAKNAIKGLESLITEVDGTILAKMESEDVDVLAVGNFTASAVTKRIEKYNPEIVMRVLGDDALPYLSVGKTALDKELKKKKGRFTPEQRAEIVSNAEVSYSEPKINVEVATLDDPE